MPRAWLNGKIISTSEPAINLMDRGLLLGDGLFETMRADKGQVPWLAKHLDRLGQSACLLGFPDDILPSCDYLSGVIDQLCREIDGRHAVIRLTLTRGAGARGLMIPERPDVSLIITANKFDKTPMDQPYRLVMSKTIRRNEWSLASRVKSLNYLDNIMARREADLVGADDAIILGSNSQVAETTIANLFALKGKTFFTAPEGCGLFAGLARSFVLNEIKKLNYCIDFKEIYIEDLLEMDAVFTCNALQGVRLACEIDGRMLPKNGQATEIISDLSACLECELSV